MKFIEDFEIIKNAPTIYCGCGSDIYTRYPFECKNIEKYLIAIEIFLNHFEVCQTVAIDIENNPTALFFIQKQDLDIEKYEKLMEVFSCKKF